MIDGVRLPEVTDREAPLEAVRRAWNGPTPNANEVKAPEC
jgi:hypothetical protein